MAVEKVAARPTWQRPPGRTPVGTVRTHASTIGVEPRVAGLVPRVDVRKAVVDAARLHVERGDGHGLDHEDLVGRQEAGHGRASTPTGRTRRTRRSDLHERARQRAVDMAYALRLLHQSHVYRVSSPLGLSP